MTPRVEASLLVAGVATAGVAVLMLLWAVLGVAMLLLVPVFVVTFGSAFLFDRATERE